jgi:hypothetical protein
MEKRNGGPSITLRTCQKEKHSTKSRTFQDSIFQPAFIVAAAEVVVLRVGDFIALNSRCIKLGIRTPEVCAPVFSAIIIIMFYFLS